MISTAIAILASALVLFFAGAYVIGSPVGWRQSTLVAGTGWAIALLLVIWWLWGEWQ